MKKLILLCLLALAGCAGGVGGVPSGATVASCLPVVLQDAQNIHQLQGGLDAITAAPVTVLPPPVMMQPPPVVVSPSPTGPVITPAPPGTIVTPPTLTPPGGPIVTPSAQLRRQSRAVSERPADLHALFGSDGHLKPLVVPASHELSEL